MGGALVVEPRIKLLSEINVLKKRQLGTFKIDYSKVQVLQYVDRDGRKAKLFREFLTVSPPAMVVQEMPRPAFPADLIPLQTYSPFHFPKGKFAIAVNADLYQAIKPAIDQYIIDLAYDGYFATSYKIKGGKPQEFREFLKGLPGIVGAVLVGNIAVPWFEMDDDFYNQHSEFPSDLYYMDLNGTWTDSDADGKFNAHSDNVQPEIFVSRLWTPTGDGNDAALINDYFRRNHEFRKGLLGYSRTGLAFVEDDWVGFDDCALDWMFPAADIEVVKDPAQTTGDRFKSEINQLRAWATICAHSSPFGHAFGSEWVPNTEISDVNPPNAFFYNLFACSNARFTEPGYMGGWYIFDRPGGGINNGLAAVGSTKTGSMLMFENFYAPMSAGKSVGAAYKDWWNALGTSHDLSDRQWFYGLTLLGDPTMNWWNGVVPVLRDPGEGDTFDYYPRLTNFRWEPIDIPGVTYTLSVDYYYGSWASDAGSAYTMTNLTDHELEHYFVGAQPGRWRVRARLGSIECPWSGWRHFKFTR
jgi:peptidase C25-like protein